MTISTPPLAPGLDAPGALAPSVRQVIPARPPTLIDRALRFGRTLFVGAWASLVDVGVVALCVRLLDIEPTLSRLIALVVSGVLVFFGNRSFAFHAQAGSIARQARLFVLTELVGLFLNLGVFRLIVTHAPELPPELVSQIANFLVFVAFCYPMRALVVFRVPRGRDASMSRTLV